MLDQATLCIASRTRQLSRLVTRIYENALRGTGLTIAQFNLLVAVAKSESIAPAALVKMFDLEKSTLSRNLRPLIDSQLLDAESASTGGQALRITGKGKKLLDKALPAWLKAQTQVTALLGRDAISSLDGMIAAISAQG